MTNEELKTMLAEKGVSENDIEKLSSKYDAEKISELVESANSPEEAMKAVHDFYPEIEIKKIQEQMDFIKDQIEVAASGETTEGQVELTEEELEKVSGGGVGSEIGGFFKNYWKAIVIGAVIGVAISAMFICPAFAAGGGAFLTKAMAGAVIKSAMLVGGATFALTNIGPQLGIIPPLKD